MITSVRFSSSVGAADRERVTAAARGFGFVGSAETSASVFRSPSSWIVELVLAVPAATFFSTLASEFGKDAYAALKGWLLALRPPPVGRVVIVDAEETRLMLDLPVMDESLRALPELDWTSLAGSQLVWDAEQKKWRRSGRAAT